MAFLKGQCLCGGFAFEVAEINGPFELCHCSRCRKFSGTAYAAMVGVKADGFRVIKGLDLVRSYTMPLVDEPPPYVTYFCSRCGSPLPDPRPEGDWLEIPAGLFDSDLPLAPDRHIYTDYAASWDGINDDLPQYTKAQIRRLRDGSDDA